MARCPELKLTTSFIVTPSLNKYTCTLCGIEMDKDDSRFKYVCDADYGCEYEKCPIYQNR